ncbi:MAG: hypothetical protein AAGJ28_05955 [Pseudomonadota bacterium]
MWTWAGWILFGLSFAGLLALGWSTLSWNFNVNDDRAVNRYLEVSSDFHFELAQRACIGRADLVSAARSRGFRVDDPDPNPYLPPDRTRPAGGAVRVHLDPPLAFAKEEGRTYWFDDQDCLTDVR